MPLVILLPQKTRREGDFCVVELPLYYEGKEPQQERGEGRANDEKEDAKGKE